jgi:hypothetical protein
MFLAYAVYMIARKIMAKRGFTQVSSTSPINPKIRKNIPRKGIERGQSHFHIHVSASDLYIPRISQPILLQENMWTDSGKI